MLAVDGWAVTFGTVWTVEGNGWGRSPPRPLLAVPNVTSHPSTASVPTSYYSMCHYHYLWSLKGEETTHSHSYLSCMRSLASCFLSARQCSCTPSSQDQQP